jgi:hypothetical protein
MLKIKKVIEFSMTFFYAIYKIYSFINLCVEIISLSMKSIK